MYRNEDGVMETPFVTKKNVNRNTSQDEGWTNDANQEQGLQIQCGQDRQKQAEKRGNRHQAV